MGLRTHFRGLLAGEIGRFFQGRNLFNPYTSYHFLNRESQQGKEDFVLRNLMEKVEKGFISLEELLSGGRAAKLFEGFGVMEKAAKRLAEREAAALLQNPTKLDRFILSGKRTVPYVIEQLPAEKVAEALHRISNPVKQRSVVDLQEIMRDQSQNGDGEHQLKLVYVLKYDESEEWITTDYFPGDVQKIFCYDRKATAIKTINRGVLISDRFVGNMGQILDALAALKVSPLDYILISLREIQGLGARALRGTLQTWPKIEEGLFVTRDHFTEKARKVLQDMICDEYEKMLKRNGDPLSFEIYYRPEIRRPDNNLRFVNITWESK